MSKTTTIPIGDLTQDKGNARRRDKRGEKAIKASLERFGAGRSVVIDGDNTIRAGNGTVKEAAALGFKRVIVVEPGPDEIVAVRRADWSEEEAKGYGIADNRTTDLSTFDESQLASLLKGFGDPKLIADIGWDEKELGEFLASTDEDGPGWEGALGALPSGDGSGFQQMTFTVSDSQAVTVREAIAKAKGNEAPDGENKNSNGNALAMIAVAYVG